MTKTPFTIHWEALLLRMLRQAPEGAPGFSPPEFGLEALSLWNEDEIVAPASASTFQTAVHDTLRNADRFFLQTQRSWALRPEAGVVGSDPFEEFVEESLIEIDKPATTPHIAEQTFVQCMSFKRGQPQAYWDVVEEIEQTLETSPLFEESDECGGLWHLSDALTR